MASCDHEGACVNGSGSTGEQDFSVMNMKPTNKYMVNLIKEFLPTDNQAIELVKPMFKNLNIVISMRTLTT